MSKTPSSTHRPRATSFHRSNTGEVSAVEDIEMGLYAGASTLSSLDLALPDVRKPKSTPDGATPTVIIIPTPTEAAAIGGIGAPSSPGSGGVGGGASGGASRRTSAAPTPRDLTGGGAGVGEAIGGGGAAAVGGEGGVGTATGGATLPPTPPAGGQGIPVHTYHPAWEKQIESMRHGLEPVGKSLPKKLQKFYASQYQLLQEFEDSSRLVAHVGGTVDHQGPEHPAQDDGNAYKRAVLLGIRLSLGVNIGLLVIKLLVAVQSGSLSILASAFDSALDLLSGVIVAITERMITHRDPIKYPQGRARLEPLGMVVLSALMTMVSVNVIVEGLRRISDGPEPNELATLDLILLGVVVVSKLLLFLYCRRFADASPSAASLALDHRNDVMTNLFGALCSFLGKMYWPYLDPLGAILFSIFVIYTWCNNALENMRVIVGHTAPKEFLQQVTFLAMHHDERIIQVETVRAFHFGVNYLVEVDIVLPDDMPLHLTHDIGESLQIKLELLPDVDRAFVHIDHNATHGPEHKVV